MQETTRQSFCGSNAGEAKNTKKPFKMSGREKRRLLLSLCFLSIATVAFSQKEDIRVEIHTQGSVLYKEFRPYEISCDIGYNITDRFFVNVRGESTIALFKIDGTKNHYTNAAYGINAGYTFLKNDLCNIDARIGFGDNMRRKQDWKYNYYDGSVYAHLGKSKVKPSIGIGVRHYNSRNSIYKDYTRFFVAIGLSFGT